MNYHLAQLNLAKARAEMDDPVMNGFVSRLDEINALAEQTPGFVWRLQTAAGDATSLRPFDDPLIIVNVSVWESIKALKAYTYKTLHVELFKERKRWFRKFEGPHLVLWWVAAGHTPTVVEAKEKLEVLATLGPSPQAFTFNPTYGPPG